MSEQDIPTDFYKAIERALDENSAWIARPSPEVTERVARAAMDYFTKSQLKHMVLDGAIEALRAINARKRS